MRIVLLGAPGCGKGTQAKLMAEKYRVPQISSGELLRQAVSEKTDLGKRVESIMASGELVSDDIATDAVTERLRSNESKRGFVLDGFPRTIPQAQQLDTRLGWMNRPLQLALYFFARPSSGCEANPWTPGMREMRRIIQSIFLAASQTRNL